jgi:RNA polymerase-binding transcription factor DksA
VTDDQAAAAVAAERAAELAALDRARADLDDVDRALDRLDAGTYGTCEVCAAALEDAVLATAPAARLCPIHARPPAG